MQSFIEWLRHNREWVFSGVGVSGLLAVIGFVRWLFRRTPDAPNGPPPREPALRISLAFGFLVYGPELSDQMLLFTVANPTDKPTQLTGIRLPLKNGANMVFPYMEGEKRLPCMIEPGTSMKFWVKLAEVEAGVRNSAYSFKAEIHGVATDGLGNDYESNTVTIG
jgi:hypothetical protein